LVTIDKSFGVSCNFWQWTMTWTKISMNKWRK
jgi:hypothetical protein